MPGAPPANIIGYQNMNEGHYGASYSLLHECKVISEKIQSVVTDSSKFCRGLGP